MKMMHAYETPLFEVLRISTADILTLSSGFDGEDHEFPMPLN